MSLETQIEQLNKNFEVLIDLLKHPQFLIDAAGPVKVIAPKAAEPKAAAPKPAAPKPEASKAAPAKEITQADISKATIDLASTKGRDTAVKLLAKYNAKNAKEIAPEQWAKYLDEATKATLS